MERKFVDSLGDALGSDCVILGFAGSGPPDNFFLSHETANGDEWHLTYKLVGQIATFWYFLHMLVILPLLLLRPIKGAFLAQQWKMKAEPGRLNH